MQCIGDDHVDCITYIQCTERRSWLDSERSDCWLPHEFCGWNSGTLVVVLEWNGINRLAAVLWLMAFTIPTYLPLTRPRSTRVKQSVSC